MNSDLLSGQCLIKLSLLTFSLFKVLVPLQLYLMEEFYLVLRNERNEQVGININCDTVCYQVDLTSKQRACSHLSTLQPGIPR